METPAPEPPVPTVSAVILSRDRREALGIVLDRLCELPVDEVVVVDNGSRDGTPEMVRARGGNVRVIELGANRGIAGRNVGAREARGELILGLDDDAYPLPGAVEALVAQFRAQPRLGVAGGRVRDIDSHRGRVLEEEVGTFDWFLRGGRDDEVPPEGVPTFFFPEGACMSRRRAHFEVGGYFEPFFFGGVEVEVATRMLAAGWDVRYLPGARFDHMKVHAGGDMSPRLRRLVRNQLWYFWLRFPLSLAARRIPAYLAFDLLLCARHRALSAWAGGIVDAWRGRGQVRSARRPLPREAIRRAELQRGRLHLQLLAEQVRKRLVR